MVDHVERRLGFWPNKQTRAEGARLLVTDGKELGEVLQQYPNEVPYIFRGKPSRADRRAIRAHYALLQEAVGEPDIDPDDRTAVERAIREDGVEMARCRTGSSLRQYEDDFPELKRFPNLAWYASQAPSSWPRQ